MSEVDRTPGGVFADPLATRINEKYREVEGLARSTLKSAIELGQMLQEKKSALPHGEWGRWVKAYFEGSERQAQRYMQVYAERDKLLANPTRVSDMSLREGLRAISPRQKEDQKEDREDSTKKLERKLKDAGFNRRFAAGIAQGLVQGAVTRERAERPLRGASDHGVTVHSLPQDLSEEMTFDDWSDEERALLDAFRGGESMVLNLHKNGPHGNLAPWLKDKGLLTEADRKTEWGNPFILDEDGDRETVVRLYEEHYLPFKPSL